MACAVDLSKMIERVTQGFESKAQMVAFGLVVGLALLFCGYLVGDGIYHRAKWRRLKRKIAENAGPRDTAL
jgi:predicted transporter